MQLLTGRGHPPDLFKCAAPDLVASHLQCLDQGESCGWFSIACAPKDTAHRVSGEGVLLSPAGDSKGPSARHHARNSQKPTTRLRPARKGYVVGYEPGGSTVSLNQAPRHLSNGPQYPWVIVIIVVLMVMCPPVAKAVSVYLDAVAVAALFALGSNMAANRSNKPRRLTPL